MYIYEVFRLFDYIMPKINIDINKLDREQISKEFAIDLDILLFPTAVYIPNSRKVALNKAARVLLELKANQEFNLDKWKKINPHIENILKRINKELITDQRIIITLFNGGYFDLINSHVLPAMIRKIHLANCLRSNDWSGISKDIERRPINGINKSSSIDDIVSKLHSLGITPHYVELWGTGKPMREFLWSEDMADACTNIMENVSFSDLSNGKNEIRNCHINIGTGREISIKDLSYLISSEISFKGNIKFDSSKPDGTMRKLTDVSKLSNLGWEYKVDIVEGIRMMYRWYLNHS